MTTFGASCFAGKLRRSCRSPLQSAVAGDGPYASLRTRLAYPLALRKAGSCWSCPLVGPVGRKNRGRLAPPQGEWSGRARAVRFARLIQRRGRDLGGPAVRAPSAAISACQLPRRSAAGQKASEWHAGRQERRWCGPGRSCPPAAASHWWLQPRIGARQAPKLRPDRACRSAERGRRADAMTLVTLTGADLFSLMRLGGRFGVRQASDIREGEWVDWSSSP